jgi:hypothetical protein
LLPITLAALFFSTSQISDLQTPRNWIVSCDKGRACHATTLHPNSAPEAVRPGVDLTADNVIGISIRRDPGPHATPHIRLLPCEQCASDPPGVREFSVLDAAGEVIFSLQLTAKETRQANAPKGLSFPPDSGLFAAMAVGERLTFGDRSLRVVGSISLRGAREALETMDISQGRSGTVNALLGRGTTAVPVSSAVKTEVPIATLPRLR